MDDAEFPVGPPVDATPARHPGDVTLDGRYGRVERLAPRHAGFAVERAGMSTTRSGPTCRLWAVSPAEAAFNAWFETRAPLDDPYCYAIVDPEGARSGIAALMEIRPTMRVDRGRTHRSVAELAAHAARDRGAVSARALRLRGTWAIAATNGNATRSTRRRGGPRCGSASRSRVSCVTT